MNSDSILGVLAAAGLCLTACAGSGKREAASLSEAVDRYRRATPATSTAQGEAVRALACADAQVCDAKRVCLVAIDATERAVALKDEVSHRLADLEAARMAPDSAEAAALPGKLDEATHLLHDGRTNMDDCDKRLTDLVVRFGR